MKVIVCIDERRGMIFNNRRQSKDRVLLENLKNIVGENRLLCSSFSDKMLAEANLPHITTDSFLEDAKSQDFCFVENISIKSFIDKIDTLIVYNWNRLYPSDLRFEIIPELLGFKKTGCVEFKGSSHEKITRETFER